MDHALSAPTSKAPSSSFDSWRLSVVAPLDVCLVDAFDDDLVLDGSLVRTIRAAFAGSAAIDTRQRWVPCLKIGCRVERRPMR